jgi:hypothetical protein
MATRTWIGNAVKTTQVRTWVFAGTWEVGDIIEFAPTGGAVIFSYTVTNTTIATFLPLLVTALNALTATQYPQLSEMTWSSSSPNLTATADEAGFPFDITITTRDAGGAADAQTIDGGTSSAGTDSTACSGPNFANVAANWSGGTLPVDGDIIVFDGSSTSDVLYGLDLNAVTPASIWVYQSYRGKIGLPTVRTTNTYSYYEYRGRYLKYGNSGDAGHVDFQCGIGEGVGSGRINFDFGTGRVTGQVFNTGQSLDTNGGKALNILGTHASNAMHLKKGSVAFAPLASETATVATLNISYVTQPNSDVSCYCGPGCTLTTITKTGGTLVVEKSTSVALTNSEGTTELNGTGAPASITVNGGKVYVNTSGTIAADCFVNVEMGLDFSRDLRAKSFANEIKSSVPTPVNDPNVVVSTMVIDYVQTVVPGLGRNIRLTRGAIS